MENRTVLRVFVEVLTNAITWGILAAVAGIFFLARGIHEHSAVAYVVLGGAIFMIVAGLGAVFVLVVQAIGDRRVEARERREQERFRDNARENLAIMQMTARVQSEQNRMLLHQARETARMLPDNDDVIDVDALVADDDVFAELEG